jgi:hypothetical protein
VYTVSNVVFETASSSASATAAPAKSESFLQNKALSGTVFALTGLVALVLIVILITWVFRRRRRDRLLDDAVSFDPSLLAAAERYNATEPYDATEKGNSSHGHESRASLGSNARPYGATDPFNPYGGRQQYVPPVPQQQAYYGAAQPQQAEYGGDYGQQQYYSSYVPPMTDAPPPAMAATTSRPQHIIPRVPVPPKALPEEFGSSSPNSLEESEFWAKTLKVTNE